MKRPLLIPLSLCCAAPGTLFAGSLPDSATPADRPSPWKMGIGGTWMPGLKADFGGLGRFDSPYRAQPAGGGRNYNYDDGFVRIDSSNNDGHLTWNWSYEKPAQYHPADGGSIDLSITDSQADASVEKRDDGSLGMEVFALREMGPVSLPLANNATWGIRLGFGFNHVGIRSGADLETSLQTTTDSFGLGGILPPPAPYQGSFGGPGPLLDDRPQRTVTSSSAVVSGSRQLDVDLGVLNIGTYLSAPVHPDIDLLVEAGASLGIASGTYEFDSVTQVAGLGSQSESGKDSRTSLLPGLYSGVAATWQFSSDWSGYASARYQLLDSMYFDSGETRASLSFESAFVLSIGVIHPF